MNDFNIIKKNTHGSYKTANNLKVVLTILCELLKCDKQTCYPIMQQLHDQLTTSIAHSLNESGIHIDS